MTERRRPARFFFVGGCLAIDFANTVRARDGSADALGSWEDLVAFLKDARVVDARQAARLLTLPRTKPRLCSTVLALALRLRDALHGVLAAMETGAAIRLQRIAVINCVLRAGAGYPQLVADGGKWRVAVATGSGHAAAALVPIARSAAELIEARRVGLVRRCANPRCVLYFCDPSPTGRRRWCSMAICGNRMKVAAFARRRRVPEKGR